MSVTPFADQERELLIELAYLFAHRDEQERKLATRMAEGLGAAEKKHGVELERARQTFEAALAAITAEHGVARGAAEGDFAAKLESATRWMKSDLAAFRQRTASMARAIASKQEETEWLAEAIQESGHGRIRPAFEAARKSIAQRSSEFDAVEQRAEESLKKNRHAPLPVAVQAAEGAGATAGNGLDGAADAVRGAAARLESVIRPVWLSPLSILGFVLVGTLIGAGAGGGRGWSDPLTAWPRGLMGARAAAALRGALTSAREVAAAALRAAEAARDSKIAGLAEITEKEWAGSKASVAALEAEIQKRSNVQEPELRAKHEQLIARVRGERDAALAAIDRTLAEGRAVVEAERDAAVRAADDAFGPVKRDLEEADRTERAALEGTWSERIAAASARLDALAGAAAAISPAWGEPVWENPAPVTGTPPIGVRFGAIRLDMAALPGGLSADPRLAVPGPTVRDLPLMIDLLGAGSVLLRAGADQRAAALGVLNNIVLRLLTGLPPGKARFTFVDPVGLGQSFAGLMHISDYEEAIVGERIWTDARHIEQRLTDLTEHMETVIQKYLRNEYETIQAYNAEAGEVAEPYRFLVIADFPNGMTDVAARKLASIATSGGRCGVFTLILTSQSAPPAGARTVPQAASGIPWAELERHSMVLSVTPSGTRWAKEPFAPWPVELEAPPDEPTTTRLLHKVGEFVKDSTRVRVSFSLVAPPEGQEWSADATGEVRLPLGRAGAKKLQHLWLGRGTAQHALVAGRTGSGKSTLLHVIITTAALWYSPDEIELYLVDFKKGVEFKTYAANRLPHARVVAVESEREFGVSVLRRLDAELSRRGTLFRDAGVQDLPSYRRAGERRADAGALARIMLIVDEFQEFFVEDDKLAQDASLLLDRLVRQGRAFGIHVVLGSQTLGGAYSLARATLGQMAVRIALQCSESDAMLIMSEDNPAARLLARPGEAIYNDTSGTVEGNSPFQVVWLSDDVRDERLRSVRERHAATGRSPLPQIVFEGHVPADIGANRLLADQIAGRAERRAVPTLWLGEPLAIKDPTGIVLRPQSAASTLVVGNQEEQGAAMVAAAVVSLASWVRSGPAAPEAALPAITILDATPPDLAHADLLPRVARELGPLARLAGPREVKEALGAIMAEIDRRDASGSATHAPMLLVVFGLQRFRDLRRSDEFSFSGDSEKGETAAQTFMKILRAGPSVGVHALVWCDTATNVDRMMERSALREFNTRVLMQMSASDSTHLVDGPQAATLGANRALLYSDDTGVMEKFRPYALASSEWVSGVLGAIRGKV